MIFSLNHISVYFNEYSIIINWYEIMSKGQITGHGDSY